MFKGITNFASMMKEAKNMQGKMAEMQEKLAQQRIKGTAGGGMVVIEINGKQDVLNCTIDEALMDDREMLEDLIVSAMNDTMHKHRQTTQDMMADATGGMPGLNEAMGQFGVDPGS
jgi:DNA-binding YbaB/EbfC family protein